MTETPLRRNLSYSEVLLMFLLNTNRSELTEEGLARLKQEVEAGATAWPRTELPAVRFRRLGESSSGDER
jgi:hypothetical protein